MRIGKIHRILIDNFSPLETKNAVQLIEGMFETESSGGITKDNIERVCRNWGRFYLSQADTSDRWPQP